MEDPLRGEPGLKLIETMLWDGTELVRGERHLARLAASCARLGWAFHREAVEERLSSVMRANRRARRPKTANFGSKTVSASAICTPSATGRVVEPGIAARVRLTWDAAGAIEVTTGPVPAHIETWRVGVAERRLDSADPWLRIKSTHRAGHDADRAELASGIDELVYVNERDEVCEGTITNVFFDRGDGWRTPPLASGCLPGVLRGELLDGGAVTEGVLLLGELPNVRLRLGNSVRGWSEARLVDERRVLTGQPSNDS